MTVDYSALLYDPIYDRLGVPAVIGTANITVIDDTRPKTNVGGSGEIISVGPGAFARMPELAQNGIAREELVGLVLTFNGRNWRVLASEPRGSPSGEDVGELRLLLKEAFVG